MYYSWRDQFLSNMDQAFATNKMKKKESLQKHKIDQMKKIIANLTIELKKNDGEDWI